MFLAGGGGLHIKQETWFWTINHPWLCFFEFEKWFFPKIDKDPWYNWMHGFANIVQIRNHRLSSRAAGTTWFDVRLFLASKPANFDCRLILLFWSGLCWKQVSINDILLILAALIHFVLRFWCLWIVVRFERTYRGPMQDDISYWEGASWSEISPCKHQCSRDSWQNLISRVRTFFRGLMFSVSVSKN